MRRIRISREPCRIDLYCKGRIARFEDRRFQAHCKLVHGSTAGIRSGHFEGSEFRCKFEPAQRRYGYVLFRWGLIQCVQGDSLLLCKLLSALLVSSPRDENPTWLVGQIIENTFEMEKVTLLNRAPPIFSLDNYFVFDSSLLKLPININLMRGYFALQGLVLFNGYGCDFFFVVNGLKDSLHQLFIGNARVLLLSHYRPAPLRRWASA